VQNPGGEVQKQTEAIRFALELDGESLQLGFKATQMTFARGLMVAGIFMRFYTLSHITFIYNAVEGEVIKFSPASCHIALADGSDGREKVQWEVRCLASIPRFSLI
jgi:hypothetical protein